MTRLRRRVLAVIAVVPMAFLTLVVPAVVAAPHANALACLSTDQFAGSVANMEHYLYCNGIQYNVVNGPATPTNVTADQLAASDNVTPSVATLDPALSTDMTNTSDFTPSLTPVSPDSGGPSCQWAKYNVVKVCYHNLGQADLMCSKWFASVNYPYHCGPLTAYNLIHAQSLWDWVSSHFSWHALKACIKGLIPGSITATIVRYATSAGAIGIIASMTGGCVGGIINFYWK